MSEQSRPFRAVLITNYFFENFSHVVFRKYLAIFVNLVKISAASQKTITRTTATACSDVSKVAHSMVKGILNKTEKKQDPKVQKI